MPGTLKFVSFTPLLVLSVLCIYFFNAYSISKPLDDSMRSNVIKLENILTLGQMTTTVITPDSIYEINNSEFNTKNLIMFAYRQK